MKKQALSLLVAMMPLVSFAKVSDFNALINDNSKAQTELHSSVKNTLGEAREASAKENVRERIVMVENTGSSYNAPTRKDFLAFQKEKKTHKASEEKQFDRLANEIHSNND